MKNIPKKIFLQIGEDCESDDFSKLNDVSWCDEEINNSDIAYILNDTSKSNINAIGELESLYLKYEAHIKLLQNNHTALDYILIDNRLVKKYSLRAKIECLLTVMLDIDSARVRIHNENIDKIENINDFSEKMWSEYYQNQSSFSTAEEVREKISIETDRILNK